MTGIAVRCATRHDQETLLDADVFDGPVQAQFLQEVLSDNRHHLLLAFDDAQLVGFLSGVHYLHPDKAAQMWINELGVNETHRRQGIATRLIHAIKDEARARHCTEVWVLADQTDEAHGFYTSLNATQEGDHIAMFTFPLNDADHG